MRSGEIQKILLEALLVAAIGAGLAFAANALSPRGLALNRNYFPASVKTTAAPGVTNAPSPASTAPPPNTKPAANPSAPAENAVDARLAAKGLTSIDRDETEKLVGDSQVVFVDARDEEKFEKGHLPGAMELDPYHPERALGTVLPACLAAREVVVYCEGGECEDADSVAIMLRDAGVPADKLVVYGGGMKDWVAQGKSVETGARP
jgi:rhodanese-related sulfurtransferase